MNAAPHETAIRRRAYAIWEEEGRPDGREWDHWERASQEVLRSHLQLIESSALPKPRKTAKGRARGALKPAIAS
jgi:hypothetical protein